jgi:ribonuclease BN (tRNA processing enzyme)
MRLYVVCAAVGVLAGLTVPTTASAQTCKESPLAVQVLGSGGPFPSSSASSGYLVWQNGRSVALVDAGGGVFHAFGRAGGRLDQLAVVAISHLHADHVSDLPALLWLSDYRSTPLPVVGPSGNAMAPPIDIFLDRLVGEKDSAFPLIHARGAALRPSVVDVTAAKPTVVFEADGVQLSALGVPHGVPAVAYRLVVAGMSIVFGGDQNGKNPAFVEFASEADLLVAHLSLSATASAPQLTSVHATPAEIGQLATKANVRALLLSHIIEPRPGEPLATQFSGADQSTLDGAVAEVRKGYGWTLAVAKDLQCIMLTPATAR